MPTPVQVVTARAKLERVRLQCLCGVAEHFADAAAEVTPYNHTPELLSRETTDRYPPQGISLVSFSIPPLETTGSYSLNVLKFV